MDATLFRLILDAGSLGILGYLLLFTLPRGAVQAGALTRWMVEVVLAELRAQRAEHAESLVRLAGTICRYEGTGRSINAPARSQAESAPPLDPDPKPQP